MKYDDDLYEAPDDRPVPSDPDRLAEQGVVTMLFMPVPRVASGETVADNGCAKRALDDSIPARLLDLLVVTTDLGELLGAVAQMACEAVPECAAASITVIHRGRPATIGHSDERALAIDEAQYRDGRGPCIDAAYGEEVRHHDVRVADDHTDPWSVAARVNGVTAVLSVSIPSAANIAAALNLYTTCGTGWPRRTLIAADALAAYARGCHHRGLPHDSPRSRGPLLLAAVELNAANRARQLVRQSSDVMCEPACGPICNMPPSTAQEAPVT